MKSKEPKEDRFNQEAERNKIRHEVLDELLQKQIGILQNLADDPQTPAGVRRQAAKDIALIIAKERKRIGSTNPFVLQHSF